MNERIKQLMDKAGITVDKLGCVDADDWVGYPELKKFAELIVRECANVAANHDALDIYEEIREHFGVEE